MKEQEVWRIMQYILGYHAKVLTHMPGVIESIHNLQTLLNPENKAVNEDEQWDMCQS